MNQPVSAPKPGDGDDLRARASALAARLEREVAVDPSRALTWVQLAEARFVAGRHAQCLEAAERAIGIDARFAPALAIAARALRRLARPADAVAAWNRAIALAPRRADYRSGLGAALVAAGDREAAYASFEQALELAPTDAKLWRDLALLCVQHAEAQRLRALLERVAAAAGFDQAFRAEARIGLQVIDSWDRFAPALASALASTTAAGGPEVLRSACEATPGALLGEDAVLLDRLQAMARAAPGRSPGSGNWPSDRSHAALPWSLIEAHFESHLGDGIESLLRSWQAANPAQPSTSPPAGWTRDLLAAMHAIEERASHGVLGADAIGFECLVRYYHARMNAHLAEAIAGRFKAMPNRVHGNEAEQRGAPERVIGTLRAYRERVRPQVADARTAAALAIYLMAKLHPFCDGNGGMGRFVASGELSQAGLGPLIVPDALREPLNVAIRRVHREDHLPAIIEVIDRCLAWRDAFATRLLEHGFRPEGPFARLPA